MNHATDSLKLDPENLILQRFSKHSKLYKSSANMGAGRILNLALGLPIDSNVPLSLSHGVDFGHCFQPLDVNYIEPIHWSYNENIHREASKIKPSLCLPHPWLLLSRLENFISNERVLVISPPPGKENDSMLLKKLSENYELSKIDVLLKHRGEIEGSINFFKKNGVGVVSAGEGDSHFYKRLFSLLSRYRKIVGCTFSSAITLAAAIGKSVEFIEDYSYEYYDVENIYDFVNYKSPTAREFVLSFINSSGSERTKLARSILGSDFLEPPEIMRKKYLLALTSSKHLLHHKRDHLFTRKLLISLGEKTSRPGIVRLGAGLGGFSKSRRKIMRIKVDELSVWKNGASPENLSFNLEDFVPGVTIPATAVSKYSEIVFEKQ